MDLVGETLGQFQIVEVLGKGGMATVYRAYQPTLQRFVALKVLSSALAEDRDLVERFLHEARAAAALHHPNVLVIHDIVSDDDLHYIVAEYLQGSNLASLLDRSGPISPERALHILCQIAAALDYAHSYGYIHRDIKPSNIMVDPGRDDHVTLMDFGLARVGNDSRVTRTGFIMGTPDYMSPEQAKGEPIDHRTDIYSLGVTMYHMFTGQVPFKRSTPHGVLIAHITEEPPPMALDKAEIPSTIEAVVRKCLAKDPNERYQWAGDMARDLEAAIRAPLSRHLSDRDDVPTLAVAADAQQPATPRVQLDSTPSPDASAHRRTPPLGPPAFQPPPRRDVSRRPQLHARTRGTPKWLWIAGLVAGVGLIGLLVVAGLLLAPPALGRAPALARLVGPTKPMTSTAVVSRAATATAIQMPTATDALVLMAPAIEWFEVKPQEQVRGAEVELRWKVNGMAATVEVDDGMRTIPGLPSEGSVYLVAEKTTVLVLTAQSGGQRTSKSIQLKVIEPSPTPTSAPASTSTPSPTGTSTSQPPTATATAMPPTSTPTEVPTHTPSPVSPTATALPATAVAIPTLAPAPDMVLSFEQWGRWKRGDQPYGELTQTEEQVQSGNYAAKLVYDFADATDDFVVFVNPLAIEGQPTAIEAWVYGDGSGHYFNVWIQDAAGQVWSVHLGPVGPGSWQKLVGAIDPNRSWPSGHVSGPDNGQIDYPVRFYGIVLDRPDTGPRTGQVYIDDVLFSDSAALEPDTTQTPMPGEPQGMGHIVFTVQVGEVYSLYATDPGWDRMVKIGDTDRDHSTCSEGNVATTLDGIAINLRPVDRCAIAGTVGSCLSPDGAYKVNTNRKGDGYSVTLWRVSDNKMLEAYYQGPLNIHPGINWAPDSSHFMFTVDQSVYRADVGQAGYHQAIPFKEYESPLQYAPDGSRVYYLKPVNGAISDIFVANPDGSNEVNLTRSAIAVKICPRWRE